VVVRLDRLGRNLADLLRIVDDLAAREIGLRLLAQGWDTATPMGRAMIQVAGMMAEYERALLCERTLEGLAAAAARGRRGGRPPAMGPEQIALARRLVGEGRTQSEIARSLGVARQTLRGHLQAPEDTE
jgi:DNA invertase Pin-like site-specific DNA recombinase